MKRILFLFLFSFISVFAKPSNSELVEIRKEIAPYSANEIAKTVAENMAKNLPQQVDAMTTITAVTTFDNKLTLSGLMSKEELEKITNHNIDEINKNETFKKLFLKETKKLQINMLCSNPLLYVALEKGVLFTYSYFLNDGIFFGSTTISIKNCKK